jgi:hypothetical protein
MHICWGCAELGWRERIWHGLFNAWFKHHYAGHRARARIYGVIADFAVKLLRP